jgi:hypothetical protein
MIIESGLVQRMKIEMRRIRAGQGILPAMIVGLVAGTAFAADDPCVNLTKLLNERGQYIQQAQGFQKKKPTADEACTVFTKLSKINVTTAAALDRDGAWCRAPDTLADNLKGQQTQIDAAKTNSCKVAEAQRKGQAAGGQHQPFGGGDEIVGGGLKLPQGAL